MASIISSSNNDGRLPALLIAQANKKLRDLGATSNMIYIFGLFAAVGAVFQFRDRLWRRRAILFADNEAACAALTRGISRNEAALLLGFSLLAAAAQYDIAIWTKRVPTQVNPADVPSRAGELSFNAEPNDDLASLDELFPICD